VWRAPKVGKSKVAKNASVCTAIFCAALSVSYAASMAEQTAGSLESSVWTFDRLDRIGGHPTTVMGNPRVVDTTVGKAIEFDGIDDAVFVDAHPLAGATTL